MRIAATPKRLPSRPLAAASAHAPSSAAAPPPGASAYTPRPAEKAEKGGASVSRRLLAAWHQAPRARVSDAELGVAVDTLFLYHHDKGYFGRRHEGARVADGLGPAGELEVMLAPNRNADRKPADGCPFCREHEGVRRGVEWRDWQVLANAYPYAPAHSRHTVIASSGHRQQGFDAEVLHDMAALQRQLTRHRGQAVTMHFNGTAGNSERHLHWHASHERLPVERWLDEGSASLEALRKGEEGAVSSWSRGPFAGLLLEGSAAFVARWAARVVDKLDADPLTQGRYNMVLLPSDDERVRMVLVPRRAAGEGETLPPFGGAWAVAGREVSYAEEVPGDAAEKLLAGAAAHVVRPAELAWLRPLLRAPEGGGLFLRCAG